MPSFPSFLSFSCLLFRIEKLYLCQLVTEILLWQWLYQQAFSHNYTDPSINTNKKHIPVTERGMFKTTSALCTSFCHILCPLFLLFIFNSLSFLPYLCCCLCLSLLPTSLPFLVSVFIHLSLYSLCISFLPYSLYPLCLPLLSSFISYVIPFLLPLSQPAFVFESGERE